MTTDEKMGCKLDGKIARHWWDKRDWSCYRERLVAEGAYVFISGERDS